MTRKVLYITERRRAIVATLRKGPKTMAQLAEALGWSRDELVKPLYSAAAAQIVEPVGRTQRTAKSGIDPMLWGPGRRAWEIEV